METQTVPPEPPVGATRKGWAVPVLIALAGVLLATSVGMAGLWAKARADLARVTTAGQTVAAVGDSMIADLRSQVTDLRVQLIDSQARVAAALAASNEARRERDAAQADYRTAAACVDELVQAHNRSTVSSFPSAFEAALVGGACASFGYSFS
jgi:hypothetical protein